MFRFVIFMMLILTDSVFASDRIIIGNSSELRNFLVTGHRLAGMEPLVVKRGCNANGCSLDLGGVSILKDQGLMLDAASKKRIQISQQTSGEQLDMDWEPLRGFAVSHLGKRWGACLEFSHTGIGKSGRFQRWISVLLVPWSGSGPGRRAYRFVGYWAGCGALTDDLAINGVSLPVVAFEGRSKRKSMYIHWHSCKISGCTTHEDTRFVIEDASIESGALIINSRSTR